MNNMRRSKTGEVKKKMSGWIIALIIAAVLFVAGGICCNTIGKTQNQAKDPSQRTEEIKK